jgi:hypothetical protein
MRINRMGHGRKKGLQMWRKGAGWNRSSRNIAEQAAISASDRTEIARTMRRLSAQQSGPLNLPARGRIHSTNGPPAKAMSRQHNMA